MKALLSKLAVILKPWQSTKNGLKFILQEVYLDTAEVGSYGHEGELIGQRTFAYGEDLCLMANGHTDVWGGLVLSNSDAFVSICSKKSGSIILSMT